MENNAIGKSYQIKIQSRGTLSVIGKTRYRIVLMASGLNLFGGENIEKFAKNPIFHHVAGFGTIIIFEYNLDGELRNPQKLLKSVRNKLMRAISVAHSEFEYEMCQLDHEISMATHHPFGHRQRI